MIFIIRWAKKEVKNILYIPSNTNFLHGNLQEAQSASHNLYISALGIKHSNHQKTTIPNQSLWRHSNQENQHLSCYLEPSH